LFELSVQRCTVLRAQSPSTTGLRETVVSAMERHLELSWRDWMRPLMAGEDDAEGDADADADDDDDDDTR
jgi:hypothetical protein